MSQAPPADHHQAMATAAANAAVTISSQLLISAVIFLFMVVVFILFLYLYAKHYMGPNPALRRSRAQFIFAAADQAPAPGRGLAEEVLKTLPIKIYSSAQFKEGLECAVCLSELSDGEEARILPKCGHGFHVQCIDMWFHSHSTCPLCRAPVTGEAEAAAAQPTTAEESLVFPTNVLFWGNQDRVSNGVSSPEGSSGSSSGSKKREGMLVIDIPRRGVEDIVSPLPTSRFAGEEMKSPMEEARTPGSARLRSLRRLLSRGKMVIGGGACSPRGGDIEQGVGVVGEASSLAPKTPTEGEKTDGPNPLEEPSVPERHATPPRGDDGAGKSAAPGASGGAASPIEGAHDLVPFSRHEAPPIMITELANTPGSLAHFLDENKSVLIRWVRSGGTEDLRQSLLHLYEGIRRQLKAEDGNLQKTFHRHKLFEDICLKYIVEEKDKVKDLEKQLTYEKIVKNSFKSDLDKYKEAKNELTKLLKEAFERNDVLSAHVTRGSDRIEGLKAELHDARQVVNDCTEQLDMLKEENGALKLQVQMLV